VHDNDPDVTEHDFPNDEAVNELTIELYGTITPAFDPVPRTTDTD